LDEKKSKHAGLAQVKWFWLSTIAQFPVASKRRRAPAEKSVLNLI
jgi:hypothetical protein